MKHLQLFKYIEAIARAGSIRKASELLAITPSALNRQLLSVEDELGTQIFERLTTGVRLNAAGEILLGHILTQMSDLDRVKSKIADLSGERVGHVKIAASPEVLGSFLFGQTQQYQKDHPGVSFSVDQYFRGEIENSLLNFSSDMAIVFEPQKLADIQVSLMLQQQVFCVMSIKHPLAKKEKVRLYECAEFSACLPSMSWGLRHLIEKASLKMGIKIHSTLQSNNQDFLNQNMYLQESLSFFIPANLPTNLKDAGLIAVPVDTSDVPPGYLFIGQLKGRTLPVAAARFLDQITTALGSRFE